MGNLFMRMYARMARSPRLFAFSQKFAALGTWLISPFSKYVWLPAFTGWGYSKDLPRFAAKPFRERFAMLDSETGTPGRTYSEGQVHIEESKMKEVVLDGQALISQFMQELTNVGGTVTCTSSGELTQNMIEFLNAREIDQIHLEPNILDETVVQKAGIHVSHTPDATLRAGVTKAICGLADTGSILVADGKGNPLQASLLPQIHIAVLRTIDLLPSLANAMVLPIVRESKAAVVITGPSRTADIEMSLTIGMHGPGEVHVFLVHTIC
jgi:L-lactate dehydrogenase complex protein LldG